MRHSNEEYSVGDIFIDKETGERYVCLEAIMREDSYFDTLYVVSEEEYLSSIGKTLIEDDIETFMSIDGYEIYDYEWVKNTQYEPYAQTAYYLGSKITI